MMWFFKAFRWSLGFALFLIGLLFFAVDLGDLPEALTAWRTVFAMIEQNTALWIFSLAAFGYIIWIDARPHMGKWRKGERREVSVATNLAWRFTSEEIEGERYFLNKCSLVVYNNGRSGRAARDVKVRAYIAGQALDAKTPNGDKVVDLNHGENEVFEIGTIIAKKSVGHPDSKLCFTENAKLEAKHNVSRGIHTFDWNGEVGSVLDYPEMNSGILRNTVIRISAADLPTIDLRLVSDTDVLRDDSIIRLAPVKAEIA